MKTTATPTTRLAKKQTVAVTGAWSFSGKQVATSLLDAGFNVISLSNQPIPDPDPFGAQIQAVPFNFSEPDFLNQQLQGVDILASAYWTLDILPDLKDRDSYCVQAD